MCLNINGNTLLKNKNVPHYIYNQFNNPTKKNIKNEIINYKVKLASTNSSLNFKKTKSQLFEPSIKIIPAIKDENIKSSEIIFAPRLKTPENYKHSQIQTLDKKMYTIYKARSTLKDRIILNRTGSDFFKQEFEPYIPLEKNTKLSNLSTGNCFFPHKMYDKEVSDSLCTILNKKKNDYIEYIQQTNPKSKDGDSYSNLLKTKKQFYKNNVLTHHLDKKFEKDKNVPFFFPIPISSDKVYKSNSEKERNVKNGEILLKLKYFMELHPDMKKELAIEFFNKQKIYDEMYFTNEHLENFIRYIKDDDIQINYRKTIQEIIDEGISYDKKSLMTKEMSTSTLKERINLPRPKTRSVQATQIGKVDQYKYSTLNQNLEEQSKLYQSSSASNISKNNSNQSKEYIEQLEKELNSLNNVRLSNKLPLHRSIKRLYYEIKQREHDEHPQTLPRRRRKLLEYIMLNQLKAKQELQNDLLKNNIKL